MIYKTPTYVSGFYIYKRFEIAKSVVGTRKISNSVWQKNLKYFLLIKIFSKEAYTSCFFMKRCDF